MLYRILSFTKQILNNIIRITINNSVVRTQFSFFGILNQLRTQYIYILECKYLFINFRLDSDWVVVRFSAIEICLLLYMIIFFICHKLYLPNISCFKSIKYFIYVKQIYRVRRSKCYQLKWLLACASFVVLIWFDWKLNVFLRVA